MSLRTALIVCAAAGLVSASAHAQTTCGGTMPSDAGTNFTATPIYVSGSTALEPMLKAFGPKLASQASTPYVIIYLGDGSCSGIARLTATTNTGMIPAGTVMKYLPPDFNPAKTYSCTIGAGGQLGDLVLSDVDATLCPGVSAQPAGTMDFHGPVNDMILIVPPTSTQQAISAEMAYLIFGMGASGMVTPFVDPMYYFIRTNDSGTRAMITANIGTGTHAWQGQDGTANGGKAFGTGQVYMNVAGQAQTNPEKTIGIIGEDYWDQGTNRGSVKALAFRAFKQHYAYWPDSTINAADRRNVREGRYAIWGYVHMIAAVTGTTPTSPAAQYFVNLIQNTLTPAPSFDIVDTTISGHLTPTCAMKVTHDIEGGALKPYTDPAPCGCYFDSKVGTAPASCTVCTSDAACGSGKCRRGFCEKN